MIKKMAKIKIGGCRLLSIAQGCSIAAITVGFSMLVTTLIIREKAMMLVKIGATAEVYYLPILARIWTRSLLVKTMVGGGLLEFFGVIGICAFMRGNIKAPEEQRLYDETIPSQALCLGAGLTVIALLIGYVTQFREPHILVVAVLLLVILVATCLLRRVCRYGTIAP